MPATVRNALKTVTKYTYDYVVSGSSYTTVQNAVSQDDVWIPSYREVNFGTLETQGVKYASLFPANANRVRAKVGGSAYTWFLRSGYGYDYFYATGSGGYRYNGGALGSRGVVLGFCM